MKTVASIFLLISAIVAGIATWVLTFIIFVWFFAMQSSSIEGTISFFILFIPALILLTSLIFSSFAYRKINKAKSAKELFGWGIIAIFLSGILPGIFILLIQDSELQPSEPKNVDSID